MSTECDTDFLTHAAAYADRVLDRVLPAASTPPARLHEAMRYAIFAGGKRIRPALVLAACRAAGGNDQDCEPAMAAVELLHTYTLVHDDLPAMDDDDLRRGRPTCHIAYDEATAILVGDALQTLAFEVLADLGADAVRCLAQASGSQGVIGGQQDDLDAEGLAISDSDECRAHLERIHKGKTAALIRASCQLGGLAAGASQATMQHLQTVGEASGLAFQIIDDILDTTASAEQLGKTPGKDAAVGKWTYPAIHGIEAAKTQANYLRDQAYAALDALGDQASDLKVIAGFIVSRSF